MNAAAPVVITALGTVIELHARGPRPDRIVEALRQGWSRCLTPAEADLSLEVEVEVEVGGPRFTEHGVAGPTVDAAVEAASQRVTIEAITRRRGELLFLHACAVASDDGRAVVLVGPSGMGKSTAARDLGSRYGYVTDETAAITERGDLLTYPKPLSLADGGAEKRSFSPDALGLREAGDPLRVVALALLDRRPGSDPTVETLETVDACAALAPHTSYLVDLERPLGRLGRLCDAVGGARRVGYRDTADLHDAVAELLPRRSSRV